MIKKNILFDEIDFNILEEELYHRFIGIKID